MTPKVAQTCARSQTACAALNAHVGAALAAWAWVAESVGQGDAAANATALARQLGAAMAKQMVLRGADCSPPAPACFRDNWDVSQPAAANASTIVQSTIFPLALTDVTRVPMLPADLAPVDFFPFLQQRQGDELKSSPWATGFMLRALYRMVLDDATNRTAARQIATYAHATLTASGAHTWLGMLDTWNATMTMEAWDPAAGSGTM